MLNERQYHRVPMRLMEARATCFEGGRAARILVRVRDLSGGGAAIISPRPLALNDPIRLHLVTEPGSKPLDLPGRIVRLEKSRQGWDVGVQFSKLDIATQDCLMGFIFSREVRSGWARLTPATAVMQPS